MNARTPWIVIIVIIIVLVGAWFAFGRTAEPAREMATATPQTTENETAPETVTVTYTDEGFSPSVVTVASGDMVRFMNQSSGDLWVGADEHPTHTSYDGTSTRDHCADGVNTTGSFDQCTRIAPGTSWSYIFTRTGSFDYHNHARATHGGTVVVE